MVNFATLTDGVSLNEFAQTEQSRDILTPEALKLVADLHRRFESRRQDLLAARGPRQESWDGGERPDYLPSDELPAARGDWRVAPLQRDLLRRRVEITGPVSDPKMVINMLSRTDDGQRADAAMLDFEDSMKPSWTNVIQGVTNVREAVAGTLRFAKHRPDGSVAKEYNLDPDDMPLLMVRVRGLHLAESNLRVDDEPVSGGLLDLTLCAFHTAAELLDQGKTPKYYVPKVEHYLEARWWNDLFSAIEDGLGLERSTMRATFLIETLPAAYQMEEILYELRDHAAGLNGGRWDKIFSDIKCFREHSDRVLADRATIGMNRSWMSNYAKQLIRVCHKHGAFGMGGMAAFTPGRDEATRKEQTQKVIEDKEFEASIGHDGCWVSHPYFIEHALRPFDEKLSGKSNQLDVIPDVPEQPDLLPQPEGPKSEAGLRTNVRVGIAYMQGWNQDIGAVAWDDLMEDLATLEISRAQVWQWRRHAVSLDDGEKVTDDYIRRIFAEETDRIEQEISEAMEGAGAAAIQEQVDLFREAARDAEVVFLESEMRPFLTFRSDVAGTKDHAVRSHGAVEIEHAN
ncbi:malate synthase A [soil metagenome]